MNKLQELMNQAQELTEALEAEKARVIKEFIDQYGEIQQWVVIVEYDYESSSIFDKLTYNEAKEQADRDDGIIYFDPLFLNKNL